MCVLLSLQRRFVVEIPKLITRDTSTGNKLRINGMDTAVVTIVSLAQAGPPEGQVERQERERCAHAYLPARYDDAKRRHTEINGKQHCARVLVVLSIRSSRYVCVCFEERY